MADASESLARISALVENLTKNVDRLVEAQIETTKMLQEHVLQPNHAVGAQALAEHQEEIIDLKKDLADLRKTVTDHSANWKVVAAAGVVLVPSFTAVVAALVHLWFS